jgi:membrane fusion protein (multidrug efflux system)
MKKLITYGLVIVAALALIFWKLNANKKANQDNIDLVRKSNTGAVPVLTETVSYTEFAQSATANGNFEAVREVTLSAENSGRVTQVLVKEGSFVRAGQVVARLDNEVPDAQLQSARSALNQAKVDMERFEKAFESGGVTKKQLDDIRLQYANAEANYTAVRRSLENTFVKAPIQGTINAKYIEVGSYVAPGNKMFDIVDISRLKLVVSVPELQVVQLAVGQEVDVTTNVFPEVTYKGKVTFIAAKGDNSLNYPVEIEVANLEGKSLRAGMYGTARLSFGAQAPAMLVPRSAFYNGVNSNTVFVLEQGKAKLRKVVAGRIFGDRVEIREGLKEGEVVITSGQVNLVDGTEVVPQQQ